MKKSQELIPDNNIHNKETNIPAQNTSTGYHNYRNFRKSPNIEFSTKNKNVSSLENKNTTQEFVNKPKYRSKKISQPTESETANNNREIKSKENKGQPKPFIPLFKKRSYFLAPKNNLNNMNKDKVKVYKRNSFIGKNNNENKDEKKNENNTVGKRFFRRFNRNNSNNDNNDNNENRIDEKKIEINEESGTSNSNFNVSIKNDIGYTTGRLINDSTDSLIKIEKPPNYQNEIEVIENDPIKNDNNPINNPTIEKKRSRFGRRRFNKTDDNLPQKDIIKNNDDFKIDNHINNYKRSSIATSFVPGSRFNPIKLYDSQIFSQIIEEKNESSNENTYSSKINTRKKTKDFNQMDSNDIILQENDEINKYNEESDINSNKKEEELNEDKDEINNINKDKDNINEEVNNNIDKYNNKNNINNYDNEKSYEEVINIEENDIDNKDNNNEANDNNIKIRLRKKNNNEYIIMDNIFNEVEQFNAKNILKGDLAEIYDELIKKNVDFKDEIFFINLNYFDKKVADCDNRLIMHSFKSFPKEEFFKKKYLSSQELLKKYSDKAERIKKENHF